MGGVYAVRMVPARQAGEAHLETRPDRQVPGLQLIQPPALVRQPCRHAAHTPAAPRGEPGPRDPDGQRQAGAGGEYLVRGVWFSLGPPRSDDAGEHGSSLVMLK